MPNKKIKRKKSHEIVEVPGMAEYVIASSIPSQNIARPKSMRDHRTPSWDGVSGNNDTYFSP